jgi:hypothetical protein
MLKARIADVLISAGEGELAAVPLIHTTRQPPD